MFRILGILLLFQVSVFGQSFSPKNLVNFDRETSMHFGAYLGLNSLSFRFDLADDFYQNDTILFMQPQALPGFNLGIISDLHLGNNFDIRSMPALHFGTRNINYRVLDSSDTSIVMETRAVESTYFELPILFKYKSDRIVNTRVYVLGGVKAMWDFASNIDVDIKDKSVVRLKKPDFGYEFGFGFDFYLQYFKFAPEIMVFHGLRNIMDSDGTQYSTSANKVFTRGIIFSLTFEG